MNSRAVLVLVIVEPLVALAVFLVGLWVLKSSEASRRRKPPQSAPRPPIYMIQKSPPALDRRVTSAK